MAHDNIHLDRLVKQASETLISRLLSWFFLLGWSSLFSSWSIRCGNSRASTSVRVRVGNAVFQFGYLRPAVLCRNSNGQHLFVAVDNGVHDRWQSWEVGSQRNTGDGGNGAAESLQELGLFNVKHARWEGVALVVYLRNSHSVGERRDVQHVEQGSLGSSDLGSSINKLEVGSNFDGTTGNLGWNAEGLEEGGFSGLHTSVTSWDVDICGSNSTGSGGSSNLVIEDLVTDSLEVAVGEDESDVALDEWKETFVLGGIGDKALDSTTNLGRLVMRRRNSWAICKSYHGVLAH
jgi:hypothetical protein